MIGSLSKELHALQNPAIGSVLLWRASVAYGVSGNAAPIPLPILFLVLPITLHKSSADILASTRKSSGLGKFTAKFYSAAESKTDLLLGIAPRAVSMRRLSMDSLQFALAKRLVMLDINAAGVFPLSESSPVAGIPSSVKTLISNAEKLGTWFSKITLFEAAVLLRIQF